jgi:hypothetical protein
MATPENGRAERPPGGLFPDRMYAGTDAAPSGSAAQNDVARVGFLLDGRLDVADLPISTRPSHGQVRLKVTPTAPEMVCAIKSWITPHAGVAYPLARALRHLHESARYQGAPMVRIKERISNACSRGESLWRHGGIDGS